MKLLSYDRKKKKGGNNEDVYFMLPNWVEESIQAGRLVEPTILNTYSPISTTVTTAIA